MNDTNKLVDVLAHSFGALMVVFLAWAFGSIARNIPLLSGLFLAILAILLLELTWNITTVLGYTK